MNGEHFDKYLRAVPKENLPYEGRITPLRRRGVVRK
jgi:hypothetical protein